MSRCFKHAPSQNSQRGDMLTEAIIGLLLFAIAGMGISFVSSSVAVSQRENKVQNQVVNELRSLLQNRADATELCAPGTQLQTSNFSTSVTINGCAATTAVINGTTITNVYTPVVLSATIEGIGEVRVGGAL